MGEVSGVHNREVKQDDKDDAWNSVLSPMTNAITQVAYELGGIELSDDTLAILQSGSRYPYLAAVRALEQRNDDAQRLVVELNGSMNEAEWIRRGRKEAEDALWHAEAGQRAEFRWQAEAEALGKAALAESTLLSLSA